MTPPDDDFDWDAHLAQVNLRNDIIRALMEKNYSHTIPYSDKKELEAIVSAYPPELLRKISNCVDPAANPRNPRFGINIIRLMIIEAMLANETPVLNDGLI